jgi:GntP family gluconate:H+ symporter
MLLAAQSTAWTTHDTRLIVAAILGIALIVVLIAVFSVHPFLALIAGSGLTGFAAGEGGADVIKNFEEGVGATLMEVGLLIALGAMLGKMLAESGGADQVVETLVGRSGPKLLPWSMALVAVIVGLPMFFEIGLVLLLPVIVLVTKRSGLPLMRVAIPALAGLSVLHGLVPPHPGPLIAISALNAQLGITLAFGLIVAVPTVAVCGPLFSLLAAKWVPVGAPATAGGVDTTTERAASDDVKRPPSFGVTLATILFPVVLMLLKALADVVWNKEPDDRARLILDFIGEPLVALFLAVVLAMFTFGYAVGFDSKAIADKIAAALPPIAGIILIVGAGGGFKQTLIGAGLGDSIGKAAHNSGLSVLLIAYLLAVAIRLATGSATVATTTVAGLVAPLTSGLSSTHLALLALAVGSGSLFLSHVNDAGFWLVNQSFRLTVGQTFKTWSVMETLISVMAFGLISALWVVT